MDNPTTEPGDTQAAVVKFKEFDGPARAPASQFQIGERVIYLPEGIYTEIAGYRWVTDCDRVEPARVHGYVLSCGITAAESMIAHDKRDGHKPSRDPDGQEPGIL